MTKIQIVFYHGGGSWIDKAIQLWTSKFSKDWKQVASHVEISLSPNQYYSASTRTGIFRKKDMVVDEGKWRTYELDVTFTELAAMVQIADSFIDMKYDWWNILGSDVLKLNIGSGDRLTCDEGVARILKKCKHGAKLSEINNLNPHTLEEYVQELK